MKKIIFLLAISLMLVVFPFFQLASPENRPGLSLEETFWIYVKAVQNSDLKSLFTTVTDEKDFFFLTSTGKLIDSRKEYYKFHEDWFREKEWEMPVELLSIKEGKEYGHTIALFYYKSRLPDGGWYVLDSYFTLIFHKEAGMWKVIGDVCTPINRYFREDNEELKYTSDQVCVFNTIKNRRTVRKFKPTQVPKEHILKILEAAHYAPTAGNQQPWKFLIIQDHQKLSQLQKKALGWYLDVYKNRQKPTEEELAKTEEALKKVLENVLSAPVYVAVLVDSKAKYSDYILYDGTLAAGYLMIAARALGYGTGFFTSFFPEDKIKTFFNIPEQYKLICFTPIGVPEAWPEIPPKKKLEELVIFESL